MLHKIDIIQTQATVSLNMKAIAGGNPCTALGCAPSPSPSQSRGQGHRDGRPHRRGAQVRAPSGPQPHPPHQSHEEGENCQPTEITVAMRAKRALRTYTLTPRVHF